MSEKDINELKRALQRNAGPDVIDMDEKFKYKVDFTINRLEDVFKELDWYLPPIKWSNPRITLITQGQGDAVNGIYKFRAQKNMLLVTPPRAITTSKNWSRDTKGVSLMFNSDFFLQNHFSPKSIGEKKILSPAIRPYIVVTDEQAKDLEAIFQTIIHENESSNRYKNELIALKIIELLIISERLFADNQEFETNLPSMDIIKRFLSLMEANFPNQHSVAFYASKLCVHPNHLNSLVKKHIGITAKESIHDRIILETKYLLHSTNLSIKEISNKLGFEDPNYFTVFFKKSEKLSPVHYRTSFA